jgi:para-nitrobenzyl esterase
MTTKHVALLVSLVATSGCGRDAGGPDAGAILDADACASAVVPRPGTVITDAGPVTGRLDGGVYVWKGIPYAAPPLGDLRWRPPAPPACWTEERAATALGPMCPQRDADGEVVGDEDCLTLNVWAAEAATAAPVLVFLHGGGNVVGSASDPLYDGAALAASTGALVVTLEYRLGALGYFASAELDAERPEHVSGNYGILDQIAALGWVQTNIAGFGGDPGRVLLFGESGGAQDALIHVASPLSSGLFSVALIESGGSYRDTLADVEAAMQDVVVAAGCASAPSVLACMRAVPAAELAAIPSAVGPLATGMRYGPSIDGYVLTDRVPDVIGRGEHNHVPFVIGTNADETSRMVPAVTTEAQYVAAVEALYGPAADALLAIYPAADYPSPFKALVRMTTDVVWTCPARRLARAVREHQTEPVYRYYFTWTSPGPAGQIIGATHGLELPFVFRTFSALGYAPSPDDLALADAIGGSWTQLASAGELATSWPRYDSVTDPYLQLDTPPSTGAGLATPACDAIDALVP